MGSVPPLLAFLLMVVSGWVHRRQLIVIEFLQAENRLLKERLRGKRIRFTDAERALLARKAKAVGRKALLKLDTLVSPDCGAQKFKSVGFGDSEVGRTSSRVLANAGRHLIAMVSR